MYFTGFGPCEVKGGLSSVVTWKVLRYTLDRLTIYHRQNGVSKQTHNEKTSVMLLTMHITVSTLSIHLCYDHTVSILP